MESSVLQSQRIRYDDRATFATLPSRKAFDVFPVLRLLLDRECMNFVS
jgi:hypothetical protein